MSIKLTFWGVRGSVPCASKKYVIYGGNTSCVELDIDGRIIIFDAGSGIRELGNDLIRRQITNATLLISHTHWDHINGFPFFMPLYQEATTFDVYASVLSDGSTAQRVFEVQMSAPFFPLPLHTLSAKLNFYNFENGDHFDVLDGDVRVQTIALNHPNGATGYRLQHKNISIAYLSDTEHIIGQEDKALLDLIQDCDYVIYDALYTDEEFKSHIGWGHSTWQEAVRLAKKANVKQLVLFHHSPDHDDVMMEKIEKHAKKEWSNVMVAKENETILVAK